MTRKFNLHFTCSHCGSQSTAETAFGRWMRNHPALDSVQGIIRTDADHIVMRYKTSLDGRDFQLLMIVEVKEFAAEPDDSQRDILSFIRQLAERKGTNLGGASTVNGVKLYSPLLDRDVRVRFFGVHLLQFERTNPNDSKWIKWDRKVISTDVLVGILAMERRPDAPDKWMIEFLRDRHRKSPQLDLPELLHSL